MSRKRVASIVMATVAAAVLLQVLQGEAQVAQAQPTNAPAAVQGPAGFTMAEPVAGDASPPGPVSTGAAPVNASYTHTPPPNSGNDLPSGSGPVMPSATIYYVFWLPTGQHYEADAAGDTNYENLLIRWAQDVGSTQFHNLVTQYNGTNGTISNTVTYGGSWVDTAAYPHAGTVADPLHDGDIQTEVHHAVTTNGLGWTEDVNHIVAVFTANGIQECMDGTCTFTGGGNGFCAYHDHFSDTGNDAVYAFMAFDNFTHVAGFTCVAGRTSTDTDPNRFNYPNGDVSADAEINTLSHEVIEAETDPHPNATWTGPLGEIGDACNFTFTPRNDIGADIYLNGHPYILQEEWSNAVHTCAIDLPTNGFCAGSVSSVCAPSTDFSKSADNSAPPITSTINYTLTLNNTNDTGANTNLTVTDNTPSGYTVTNVSAPGSTSSSFTPTSITVGYDTLPVHQSRTVTVTATVPVQVGITATNCGSLSGSDLLGTALSGQTTSPCAATTPVKATPTLTTTAPATSLDGQPMFDTALLAGGVSPGGSMTFTVYGPNDTTCSNPPAFPPMTTPVSGDGSYPSAPVTPFAKPGLYRWVASYSGDTNNNAVTTLCGAANETVNVLPAANLTITKTDDAPGGHVLQGQQLTYTIGVSNSGPDPAENVQVTDTIPATTVFAGASPGCVNAAGTVTCSLGTVGVGSGSAKSAQIVVLVVGSTTPISNSATVSTTTANTNPIHTATDGTIVDQACTTTLTGKVAGSLVVPSGEALCLNGATVGGSITVRAGGALTSNVSTINGSVSTTGARALTLCATTVSGAIKANGTIDMVRIGDDDYTPACAGGKVGGSVSAQNNQGGVELFGNTITGSVLLSGNHGASPLSEDKTPEVEANTVSASLSCTSNIPGVTNDAQPNTVHGARSGQCVGL